MKILWHSNSPFAGSGYGVQTDLFSRALAARGHEILISAYYGHRGAKLTTQPGIDVLPGSMDAWGNDILPAHWSWHKPDVALALMDIWVIRPDVLRSLPLGFWTPIDHEPMPPMVAHHLRSVRHPIAMSRFGEREMRKAGLDPFYVPHAVETDVYKPGDRAGARETLGYPADKFIACVVAANKGTRKNYAGLLKAWARFVETHADALLHIHALPGTQEDGMDLYLLVDFYGIPRHTIEFSDPYLYAQGHYGTRALNTLYNAADVFVLPSMGEGFGVPIIEAQSAGCPVIVTDFTAMRELCFGGFLMGVDDDERVYTNQGSEQAMVAPSKIVRALEYAYEERNNPILRTRAREGAMGYDLQRITERYMLPTLECMAEINRAEAIKGSATA